MAFRRNPAFITQFKATPSYQAGMKRITVIVAEAIRVAALPYRDSGNYIRRIDTRGTRVQLEKHFAHLMEYGSVNNPPQANVRRGVIAAGLRFSDDHEHTVTP